MISSLALTCTLTSCEQGRSDRFGSGPGQPGGKPGGANAAKNELDDDKANFEKLLALIGKDTIGNEDCVPDTINTYKLSAQKLIKDFLDYNQCGDPTEGTTCDYYKRLKKAICDQSTSDNCKTIDTDIDSAQAEDREARAKEGYKKLETSVKGVPNICKAAVEVGVSLLKDHCPQFNCNLEASEVLENLADLRDLPGDRLMTESGTLNISNTAQMEETKSGRDVLRHIVACALDTTQAVRYIDEISDIEYVWPGGHGIAPEWSLGALTSDDKIKDIDECLISYINDHDTHVHLMSGDEDRPSLTEGDGYQGDDHMVMSGVFYGHVMGHQAFPGDGPHFWSCYTLPRHIRDALGDNTGSVGAFAPDGVRSRDCPYPNSECGVYSLGFCGEVCETHDGLFGEWGDCKNPIDDPAGLTKTAHPTWVNLMQNSDVDAKQCSTGGDSCTIEPGKKLVIRSTKRPDEFTTPTASSFTCGSGSICAFHVNDDGPAPAVLTAESGAEGGANMAAICSEPTEGDCHVDCTGAGTTCDITVTNSSALAGAGGVECTQGASCRLTCMQEDSTNPGACAIDVCTNESGQSRAPTRAGKSWYCNRKAPGSCAATDGDFVYETETTSYCACDYGCEVRGDCCEDKYLARGTGYESCPDDLTFARGQYDSRYTCYCSAERAQSNGAVWGTGLYSDDSHVCRAAVHDGVIRATGGTVTAIIQPGQPGYQDSTKNRVTSGDGGSWPGSYRFAPPKCPTHLSLPRGVPDSIVTCNCPASETASGDVYGTRIYNDNSEICPAAVHAGVITGSGGVVTAMMKRGLNSYAGSTQNGVVSKDSSWHSGSFEFIQDCPAHLTSERGNIGDTLSCRCSASATVSGALWGTGTYSDDSRVCRAAVHAGVISNRGGVVTAVIRPGLAGYLSTAQNEITSYSRGSWGGSYEFVAPACPSDLTSRRSEDGHLVNCLCSSWDTIGGDVWGTDIYADASHMCRAAVHAGMISSSGGPVTARVLPGQSSYSASIQYDVTSLSTGSWDGSFEFVSPEMSASSVTDPWVASNVEDSTYFTFWMSEVNSGNEEWVQISYPTAFFASRTSIVLNNGRQGTNPWLQASHDGQSWVNLATFNYWEYPNDENNMRHIDRSLNNDQAYRHYRYHSNSTVYVLLQYLGFLP